MLEITKETIFRGVSKVKDSAVKMFEARINSANPKEMTFNHYVVSYDLHKNNRSLVAADEFEFEDMAYAFQDTLLSETGV